MNQSHDIATHLRQVFFGGNWTDVNLKVTLEDVTWQQAVAKVQSLNTIVALVYHIGYYVTAITGVMQNNMLEAKDKFSFDHPPINNEEDWQLFTSRIFADAEKIAALVEQLPDNQLSENFHDGKYGSWYRNLHGLIEHTHYHLGQIRLIKKLLQETP